MQLSQKTFFKRACSRYHVRGYTTLHPNINEDLTECKPTGCFFTNSSVDKNAANEEELSYRYGFNALCLIDNQEVEIALMPPRGMCPRQSLETVQPAAFLSLQVRTTHLAPVAPQ